jgi:hypothetical protein
MTSQPTLWDDLYREPLADPIATPPVAHPMARATDPESSHLAAKSIEERGKARAHRILVESYVYRAPGKTSKELSEMPWCELDRHEVARRLSEVEREGGIVSKADAKGRKELRWFPAPD